MNETGRSFSEAELLFNFWREKLSHFSCVIGEGEDSPVKIAVYFSVPAMVVLSDLDKFRRLADLSLSNTIKLNGALRTHMVICFDRPGMFTIVYGWFCRNGSFAKLTGPADDFPVRLFKRSLDHILNFIGSSVTNSLTVENGMPVKLDLLTEYPDLREADEALNRR